MESGLYLSLWVDLLCICPIWSADESIFSIFSNLTRCLVSRHVACSLCEEQRDYRFIIYNGQFILFDVKERMNKVIIKDSASVSTKPYMTEWTWLVFNKLNTSTKQIQLSQLSPKPCFISLYVSKKNTICKHKLLWYMWYFYNSLG